MVFLVSLNWNYSKLGFRGTFTVFTCIFQPKYLYLYCITVERDDRGLSVLGGPQFFAFRLEMSKRTSIFVSGSKEPRVVASATLPYDVPPAGYTDIRGHNISLQMTTIQVTLRVRPGLCVSQPKLHTGFGGATLHFHSNSPFPTTCTALKKRSV